LRQRLKLVLISAWLLVLCTGCRAGAQAPVQVVILHTNDIHGQLLPKNGVGGIAEIAAIVRREGPDLVLDAGDLFTGTYLSDHFQGVPTIRAMNAIGYTAAAVGNHEFDYGQDALRMRLREASFPFLSANIQTPVAEIVKYMVKTVKGIRIGIIGATTEDLTTTTHPRNLGGVTVSSVVQSVGDVLPELRPQTDFIVVVAHISEAEERRLAEVYPEIRLIIGGHVHSALGPIFAGTTVIAKTGSSGRNVGRVDLDFDGKSLRNIESRLIPVQGVEPDPDIAAIIAPFQAEAGTKLQEVVGDTTGELASSSVAESPLGNLVADAMRRAGKTQIAIQNPGGIRARIASGPITWGEVFDVLPFQNTLVTMKLSGAQLKRVLDTRLLVVSGLRIRMKLQAPSGQRLVSAALSDGTPLEDARTYTVTTNDFLLAGGDGVSEFSRGSETKDTGVSLRDVFIEYLRVHRPLSPSLDGRITIVP
jgi:2',3'-cyclic-nucleotide 2'-phosphodiesterase (5'-nucleotidase family)